MHSYFFNEVNMYAILHENNHIKVTF